MPYLYWSVQWTNVCVYSNIPMLNILDIAFLKIRNLEIPFILIYF